DPEWWVRYRAANALADLPFVGPAGLAAIRAAHDSDAARDIIGHVLAERAGP
ncbi:MAG: hypothetical protein JWM80_2651, partial [Cyanobacteria bacterium RYN_339]|nr:hypothetical protein [Cyanobacteria bacterium RYN_339]